MVKTCEKYFSHIHIKIQFLFISFSYPLGVAIRRTFHIPRIQTTPSDTSESYNNTSNQDVTMVYDYTKDEHPTSSIRQHIEAQHIGK